MSTPYDVAAVFGDVFPIPVPPTSSDQKLLTSDCRLCGWSLRDATGDAAVEREGQVTSPGAVAVITLIAVLPNGTYDVTWSVALQGAAAAADANNFTLNANNAVVVGSINPGAAGVYPQTPARVTITTGVGISVNTILAGTVGVTYLASFEATPVQRANTVVEIQDVGNILGEFAPFGNESDTEYFGEYGIPCQGQILLHVVSGAVTGVVYVKLQR